MYLEAIRLKEVGCFREGIALEGISAGLNLLASPNETGKSTIFRAIETVFAEAHGTQKQGVKQLQPYAGGAPLIECDFAINGEAWRLRKQYVAGRAALLTRRDRHEIFVGGDAEEKLAKLLAGRGGLAESMGFLWVTQGGSFSQPKVEDKHRQTFAAMLQGEIDQATGTGELAEIQRQVHADLFKLITESRGQPRAGSDFARAIQDCKSADETLAKARAMAEQSAERRRQLFELAEREQILGSNEEKRKRRQRLEVAQQAVAEARDARSKYDVALAQSAQTDEVRKAALITLQRFDANLAELAAGAAQLAKLNEAGEQFSTLILNYERQRDLVDAKRETDAAEQGRLHKLQIAAERIVRIRDASGQADELAKRFNSVSALDEEKTAVRARLDMMTVCAEDVGSIREREDTIRILRAQQRASAPSLKFRYSDNASRTFEIGDRQMEEGAEVIVTEPIRIDVQDVGSIEIIPADVEDAASVASAIKTAAGELAELLVRVQVKSRSEAEAALAVRIELERQLEGISARRAGLAPDGINAITTRIAELKATIDSVRAEEGEDEDVVGSAQIVPREQLSQQLSELASQIAKTKIERDGIDHELREAREGAAHASAKAEAQNQRQSQLAAEMPMDDDERDSFRAGLEERFTVASTLANAALRELDAWQEALPSPEAIIVLEKNVVDAQQDLRTADRVLADTREQGRMIEGALRRDSEEGIEAQVMELSEKALRLGARLAQMKHEIEALTLLHTELGEVLATERSHLAAPIARRLEVLAADVFPGVGFNLTENFLVEAVVREGHNELFDNVSYGMREQVAVLVRLALAQCMSETTGPLPVILDDALVFSDDARLGRVFASLNSAANLHQLIVLTCHERAFGPLVDAHAGKQLAIVPWSGDSTD